MKSEQGIRSAFFENKNLQLIRVKAMDGALEKTTEWYYTDGQLVYCETNWYNPETKTNIFTEKCYLHKRHLIYWSNSRDKTIPSSSDAFKKMDAELFVYGEKIKAEALK
jgi:hypothetical protein